MNPIYLSLIIVFVLINFAMFLLLKLNPFAIEQKTLYQNSISTIWNSIVTKITSLLS